MKQFIEGDFLVTEYDSGAVARELRFVPVATPPADTSASPVLVVTSVTGDRPIQVADDLSACTMQIGTTATITAELRDAGGSVISMTDSFRMPLRKRGGGEGMLLAQMVNGVATVTAQMSAPGDDGVWTVTEQAINEGMLPGMYMRFAGFTVSIYR